MNLPDTATASAEKIAAAILFIQSRTPCREQFAMMVTAVENIRLAERQRERMARKGAIIATFDLWEACNTERPIEGESVWGL